MGLGDRLSVYKARGFFVPRPHEIVTQATRRGCNGFHAFKEWLVASALERCYIGFARQGCIPSAEREYPTLQVSATKLSLSSARRSGPRATKKE
jgi:hypothetical protein